MLVLDEADIAKLLDMDAALAAVRTALLDVYRGTARNPVKERAALDGQTLHSTGAVLRTGSGDDDAARTWHGATVYVSGSVRAHWTLVFNGDEGLRAVVAAKTLARAHSGDLRTAVADGALAWDDVRHLGAALDGPPVRPDSGAITVFCSHGVGSWDLELARTALERAEAAGTGHRLGLVMGQWRDGM